GTCRRLDVFWELIDEVLNAVLFVLLGLEVLKVTFTGRYLVAGLLAVPAVLLARFLSAGLLVWLLRRHAPVGRGAVRVLTWGGLRGGLSGGVALALPRGVAGGAVPPPGGVLLVTHAGGGVSPLRPGPPTGPP